MTPTVQQQAFLSAEERKKEIGVWNSGHYNRFKEYVLREYPRAVEEEIRQQYKDQYWT